MPIYTVQNEKGDQFQVKQENLDKAVGEGYLPLVKKGDSESLRVKPENLQKASADGYSPVMQEDLKPAPSVSDAIMQGVEKGGSLGFKDRISGIIDAALGSKFGNMFVPEGGQNPYKDMSAKDLYEQGKRESAQQYSDAEQAHPIATAVGGFFGGIPAAIAAGPSIKGGMALGAAYGAGSADDDLTDIAKKTAIGAGIGGVASGVGKLLNKGVGAGLEALESATPAMSMAKTIAKVGTGLVDENQPIPSQSTGEFFGNLGKGAAAGHVGSALGIPSGPVMGVGYALSRTPAAQSAAQSALQTAGPALKATDTAIQSGASMINQLFDKLTPELQKTVSDAAQQGERQLSITHFLLGNTSPQYQSAMSQK